MKYGMVQKACERCGANYEGGWKAHYCQRCRRKQQSEWAREHGLNRMGQEAYKRQCAERRARKKGEWYGG